MADAMNPETWTNFGGVILALSFGVVALNMLTSSVVYLFNRR